MGVIRHSSGDESMNAAVAAQDFLQLREFLEDA